MKISEFGIILKEALQSKTAASLILVYEKTLEIDSYYFMKYPRFRCEVIKSIQRNYWHPDVKFAAQNLAKHIQKIYETTDLLDSFVEHPYDSELYAYLLDIEENELETISDDSETEQTTDTEMDSE